MKKGGKRPLPFLQAIWGSGGRRFESSHPDQKMGKSPRTVEFYPENLKRFQSVLVLSLHASCSFAERTPLPVRSSQLA